MQSVLQEWKIYEKLYDDMNMMAVRFGYCMEHSKPVVVSLEALRCQVQNLQVNEPDLAHTLLADNLQWKQAQQRIHWCLCSGQRCTKPHFKQQPQKCNLRF